MFRRVWYRRGSASFPADPVFMSDEVPSSIPEEAFEGSRSIQHDVPYPYGMSPIDKVGRYELFGYVNPEASMLHRFLTVEEWEYLNRDTGHDNERSPQGYVPVFRAR